MNNSFQSFGNLSSSVYGNTTESVSGDDILLMCSHDSMDRCYSDYAWKYLIFTLSIISVVVNAFHLFVLKRLPAIRGTSYLFVLQQITVADIYASVMNGQLLCFYHRLYVNKHIMIGVLFATLHEHCGFVRFNALAVASIERFLSLCHKKGGDMVCFSLWSRACRIKVTSAVLWFFALIYLFLRNYLFREKLCVWALYGPSTKGSAKSSAMFFSYIAGATLIIVVCNFKVLRELKKIASQRQPSDRDNQAKRAVYYLMIINVAFYTCLIPLGVLVTLGPLGISITKARWVIHLFYTSYGIFNVVIYGFVMKPYRTLISALFLHGCKNVDRPHLPESRQVKVNCSNVSKMSRYPDSVLSNASENGSA